ncbi:CoA pyrophosphatase [Myxococcota bacterium]|nr:CoA pyrophosphatase [Myxococcota bacterium]
MGIAESVRHGGRLTPTATGAALMFLRRPRARLRPRYVERVANLKTIRERLSQFDSVSLEPADHQQAAVALVLREGDSGIEILFIERSTREDDPWSGHMAFPGGRVEAADVDTRSPAERETLEEVGVSLSEAEYLGHLADLQGSPRFRQNRLIVSAHVYSVEDPAPFVLDEREVATALWFPVQGLSDPSRHVPYRTPAMSEVDFPGLLVGEPERHIVWGLTYRFVDIFMGAIERPLPDRWDPSHEARWRQDRGE